MRQEPENSSTCVETTGHLSVRGLKHWADGGPTSLDNLRLLCRHHHRLVHEGDPAWAPP